MKKKNIYMKNVIVSLLISVGIVGGLCVGGWMFFIQPIIEICRSFDSALIVGTTVSIGSIIAYIAIFVYGFLRGI